MIRRFIGILLWLYAGSPECRGQFGDPRFNHLSTENGLSQSTNVFLYKDSRGFVWISSMSGLNRFDGQKVKVYKPVPGDSLSMLGENIQGNICEDGKGNVWFATFEGINCYQRKSDQFSRFTVKGPKGEALPSYYTIGIDQYYNLWLIHRTDKVYKLNTQTGVFTFVNNIPSESHRGRLFTDKNKNVTRLLSFSLNKPGLSITQFERDTLRSQELLFAETDKPDERLFIYNILGEGDSACWLAASSGLLRLNLYTRQYTRYPAFQGKKPTDICHVGNRYLGCGLENAGLILFDKISEKFVQPVRHILDDKHSLFANDINALYTDRDEVSWISLKGVGVDFADLKKVKFKTLFKDGNEKNGRQINSILEDAGGKIWCATGTQEIIVLNENKEIVSSYGPARKSEYFTPPSTIYHLFQDRQNRIWLLKQSGLYVKEPGRRAFIPVDTRDGFIYGLQLYDGRLWFAGFKGGVRELKNGPHGKYTLVPVPEIDPDQAYTLMYLDGRRRLWMGKNLQQVVVYDLNAGISFLKELPVGGPHTAFCEDPVHRVMWIGGSKGLSGIRMDDFSGFEPPGQAAFPITGIAGLLLDEAGQSLWISFNKGIAKTSLANFKTEQFGLSDGLSALEFRRFSALKRKNGEFWFGSVKGITWFKPEEVKRITTRALPQITELFVNDTLSNNRVCNETRATNITEIRHLTFDYRHNTLSFTLVSLEYSDPLNNRIRYILSGTDRDTLEAMSGATVRYPQLPAGKYVLSVWAANSDGIWNPDPKVLQIRILPPFWQTWWFVGLSSLAILAAVSLLTAFYYRYRLRAQQLSAEKEQREAERKRLILQQELALRRQRDRIAEGIHDDLGAGLSHIRFAGERALKAFDPEQAKNILQRISALASELDDNRRSLSWATDPEMDFLSSLLARIRKEAGELFEDTSCKCRLDIPAPSNDRPLSGVFRLHVLRAVKEALNNVLRHAGATSVHVEVVVFEENMVIFIRDDGKGFDPESAAKGSGRGLRNIEKHMMAAGGSARWTNNPTGGMTLRLEVDFRSASTDLDTA